MGGRDCQDGQGLSVWEAGAISMGGKNCQYGRRETVSGDIPYVEPGLAGTVSVGGRDCQYGSSYPACMKLYSIIGDIPCME